MRPVRQQDWLAHVRCMVLVETIWRLDIISKAARRYFYDTI